jgi:hypothetical protein
MAEDSEMIRVSRQICAARHDDGAGSYIGLAHFISPFFGQPSGLPVQIDG